MLTKSPVLRAFGRTLRYHLGSLALGALILAVVQTIRAIITYIQVTMKRHKDNRLARALLGCLNCCCACLESVIKLIDKNAYIEIAVYGYSFCEGARIAVQLLTRNALR